MVLRPQAVRDRLLRLEEVISGLEELRSSSAPPRDRREVWAVERGLQLGAEILFDVGNHVLSAHFGVAAQGYEDIVAQLEAVGVLDAKLRESLRGLGGFRNVLVHGYLRVDPDRVAEHLERAPRVFSEFSRTLRRWLEELPGGTPPEQ